MEKPIMIESPDLLSLRKICQEYIDNIANNEYIDDDFGHYVLECALEAFFGKDVWKFVNHKE
jgi:hypothetical protein